MIRSQILLSAAGVIFTFILVIITALRIAQPQLIDPNSYQNTSLSIEQVKKNYEATQSALIENLYEVKYPLPFPGILPNHPLYWLKMIRDRITLTMINDPHEKFSYILHLADKRLTAGQALIIADQDGLGVSTITKAEKYLLKATKLSKTLDEKAQQEVTKGYLKHKQIINLLKEELEEKERSILDDSLILNESILETQLIKFRQIEEQEKQAYPSSEISQD
jgi:uncharacterized protein DUF5667